MASLKDLTKGMMGVAKKKSPEILTGVVVAGTLSTAVLAVKATPRALELIREEEEFRNQKLSKMEIVKTTWKCYIPAVGVGAITIASVIFANTINTKRNAALAGLYAITETAFKDYQAKVVETIGQNKELKVRDELAADKLQNNPLGQNNVIITGSGDMLCYDALIDRYFRSDIEKIRQTVNELNMNLRSEHWISLNEFYYELGLSTVSREIGDELGFHIDRGGIQIDFSSQLANNGHPCLVLNYKVHPSR